MLLFTTDVINEADSATVATTLADRIRDEVVLHPAWELVEEFTPGGGPRWTVLRCLSTESTLPDDFFVVIEKTAGGTIRMSLCEAYDEATHTMTLGPKTLSVQNIPYDVDGHWTTGSFVLNTDQLGLFHYQQWAASGNNTNYWLIVADDGLTVAMNGANNSFMHLGAYDPLTLLPIDMPLQIIGQSSEQGAVTRNPAVAGETALDVAMSFKGGGGNNPGTGPYLGYPGSMSSVDALQGDLSPLAEQGMTIYPWSGTTAATIGSFLGKQKRMRVGQNGTSPAGFAWGDSYILDGTLWVPWYPTDFRIWDTGVAA